MLDRPKKKMAQALCAQWKQLGWTQARIAKEMDSSQSRISRLSGGDVEKTSLGTLAELTVKNGRDVRIYARQPRPGRDPRISFFDHSDRPSPTPTPADLSAMTDIQALSRLLAEKVRENAALEANAKKLRQQVDELGGAEFEELMTLAVEVKRVRSAGDRAAADAALERFERALAQFLTAREDDAEDEDEG